MRDNYYGILGVNRDASERAIHRAFRRLALLYHPDVNKDADAEVTFKKINEAHRTLSDEQERTEYNQFWDSSPYADSSRRQQPSQGPHTEQRGADSRGQEANPGSHSQGQQAGSPGYAPSEGRANLVTGVFVVYLLVEIISIISTYQEISLLERIRDGGLYTIAEADASDVRQGAIGLLYLLIFVLLITTFLMWLYRVRKNEAALIITGTRFSVGWSIWVWFIPIMQLFRPYQIMKEAWQASSREPEQLASRTPGPRFPSISWQQSPISPLLGWWWALWLVGNYIANIGTRFFFTSEDDVDSFIASDWMYIGSSILLIGSAVLAIILVRQISERQVIQYWEMQGIHGE